MVDSGENKKMDDTIQRGRSLESRRISYENFLCPHISFQIIVGVEVINKKTKGVFSQVLHTKLDVGEVVDGGSLPAPVLPPRSPEKSSYKMSLLSPVTPVELPRSPVLPMKKLRGLTSIIPIQSRW